MSEDIKPKEMKMPEIKGHVVHLSKLYREALRECSEFKHEHEEDVIRSTKTEAVAIVYMKDTTIHYFMSEAHFDVWCLGRTYTIDGKKYHSGYEVAE